MAIRAPDGANKTISGSIVLGPFLRGLFYWDWLVGIVSSLNAG